ncbi:MAG: amidohydrolase family protein, partial [Gemmatimonadales bacterium]
VENGAVLDVPLDLRYTPDVPAERLVVHAGHLVDGKSEHARDGVDIVIVGNRIRSVEPHRAALHSGARVVDASNLTVMPGLVEYHSHLQPDYGESQMRSWLAFGITTVRSPGGTPYEAAADREMADAGVRPSPRIYSTGYLFEWNRAYYKMSVAISSPAHLELELQRAKVLQHDLIKSYVRMPDLQQRRIVEFAHDAGVPSSSHEVFPAAFSGIDGTEHTTGTSRRGYSPKLATLTRAYEDVNQILGKAGMTLTPTLALSGVTMRNMIAGDSTFRNDPRLALHPSWLSAQITSGVIAFGAPPPGRTTVAGSELVMSAMKAGAHIVAGTDTPSPAYLHAELMAYVAAGMTPFEALRTATVNAAAALQLDAGTIEAGKLADLAMVDGNPLLNIAATRKVKKVMVNGRVYDVDALVKGTIAQRLPVQAPR